MTAIQLAKLVDWAGTLRTRKRIQKCVYLLQAAGCEIDAEYMLHYYGPYSFDVAGRTDQMVNSGLLLEEKLTGPDAAVSFSYTLSETGRCKLGQIEQTRPQMIEGLTRYERLAKRLLNEQDIQLLELAATVAYYHTKQPVDGWRSARCNAAKVKGIPADRQALLDAEDYARSVVEGSS